LLESQGLRKQGGGGGMDTSLKKYFALAKAKSACLNHCNDLSGKSARKKAVGSSCMYLGLKYCKPLSRAIILVFKVAETSSDISVCRDPGGVAPPDTGAALRAHGNGHGRWAIFATLRVVHVPQRASARPLGSEGSLCAMTRTAGLSN